MYLAMLRCNLDDIPLQLFTNYVDAAQWCNNVEDHVLIRYADNWPSYDSSGWISLVVVEFDGGLVDNVETIREF